MAAVAALPSAESIEYVGLDQIDPAPDNPRRDVGDVSELAASIRSLGLLEPMIVTPRAGRYLLVCGARRYAACLEAGINAVDVIVRDFDETTRQEAMLIENLQRTDLTVLEEARAYGRLVELGHSQRRIAERIGKSQSHVSKRVALLQLPEKALKNLDSGGITIEDALELTRLAKHPKKLDELVRRGVRGSGLKWYVDEALRDVEREAKAAALDVEREAKAAAQVSELTAAGKRVIEFVPAKDIYSQATLPDGTAVVEKGVWRGVDLDPKKHEKQPCSAMAVDPRHPEHVIHVCTDPASHGAAYKKPGNQGAGDEAFAREREKQMREQQRREAEHEKRREFVAQLVRGRVPKADAIEQVAKTLLWYVTDEYDDGECELACIFLGLDTAEAAAVGDQVAEETGEDDVDHIQLLHDYAAKDEAHLLRAGLALAAAAREIRLGNWVDWTPQRPYFAFLERNGYTPTKTERAGLDRKETP